MQEIQAQFRQFQGQLDSIAHSVTTESKVNTSSIHLDMISLTSSDRSIQDVGAQILAPPDLLEQLVKGYQETAEILRIITQAHGAAPAGPSRGDEGQGQGCTSMEVDPRPSVLQIVKVVEEPKERSPQSNTLAVSS